MILEARGLSKAYDGVAALRDVSFTVDAGERVAMIGPNGAGKTTCFNLLNGQLAPDAGDILLEGRSIRGMAPRRIWRRGVGRTFQVAQTFSSMTVRENVQVALASHFRGLWNFFGGFAAAGALCTATNALLRVHGVMKQSARHALHLRTDRLRRFIFSASPCPRFPAFTNALVALRIREVRRSEFNRPAPRARDYAA